MSKRTSWLIVILLVVVAFFAYSLFFHQTYTRQVTVPFTMFKVSEQFRDPANVARWYVPFTAGDIPRDTANASHTRLVRGNYALEIRNLDMVTTELHASAGDTKKEFLIVASPDSATPKRTSVQLSYKNTLFKEWFGKNELVKNAITSLSNLKDYMEDPKRLYGYEIQVTTVADTSFLFGTTIVPVSMKRQATRNLFDQLIAYAHKKNAGYTGVRILYTQVNGNEITLFASIGVSNRLSLAANEPFQYKMMPFGKKLLEANYQGMYGDVHKVYTALEAFKADHNLISMAIPFQKFMNDGYDFADSQLVQMKVYYPIF